ncbi:hypothetical protein [Pedobacter sp.]|uniref:hypothetical protein n=1 Tax=Pedobacter sp. TaxID=1411316 RepID=UPI003D7FCA9B
MCGNCGHMWTDHVASQDWCDACDKQCSFSFTEDSIETSNGHAAETVTALLPNHFALTSGESSEINGVVIKSLTGNIEYIKGGYSWWGDNFQISTKNGDIITRIEITAGVIFEVNGDGWTETSSGVVWTGSARSVNVGGYFEEVTSVKVTYTTDSDHATTTGSVLSQGQTIMIIAVPVVAAVVVIILVVAKRKSAEK